MERQHEGNDGARFANRLDAPEVPFVDFPLDEEINQEEDGNATIELSSDDEDEASQSTLSERIEPLGQDQENPVSYTHLTLPTILLV